MLRRRADLLLALAGLEGAGALTESRLKQEA
jgi:hypothetical protein